MDLILHMETVFATFRMYRQIRSIHFREQTYLGNLPLKFTVAFRPINHIVPPGPPTFPFHGVESQLSFHIYQLCDFVRTFDQSRVDKKKLLKIKCL